MTFDELFNYYANYGFTRPINLVPSVQGIGSLATPTMTQLATPTMTQPASTVSGISDSIGFAPSTSPTSSVGKGIGSISMADVGKAIGFAMNPALGIASIGFESVTGKNPAQAIADAMGIGTSTTSTTGMGGFAPSPGDTGGAGGADAAAGGTPGPGDTGGAGGDPSDPGSEAGGGGGSSGGGKIVCTMMNESYGFGSFRNKIWLKHSKDLPKEYEKGYHKIFLPLVKYAKSNKLGSKVLKKTLEHIAKHRTIDIKKEFKGNTHLLGRVYRKVLEPICYWVGKLNG